MLVPATALGFPCGCVAMCFLLVVVVVCGGALFAATPTLISTPSLPPLVPHAMRAVSYEAAWTLVSLSTAPTAVRACAQTYATLLNSSNDNNVRVLPSSLFPRLACALFSPVSPRSHQHLHPSVLMLP